MRFDRCAIRPSSATAGVPIVLALGCAAVVGAVAASKWPQSGNVHIQGICFRVPRLPFLASHPEHSGTVPAVRQPPVELMAGDGTHAAEKKAETQASPVTDPSLAPAPRPWMTEAQSPDRAPRFNPNRLSAFWTTDEHDLAAGDKPRRWPSVISASHGRQADPSNERTEPTERLGELFRRLHQRGALVMRLEKHPGDSSTHRFRCELPLSHAPRYRRFFQVYDADPIRAVERVLAEVEAWQSVAPKGSHDGYAFGPR